MFNFEKLRVYQKAVEFADIVFKRTAKWSRQYQYNLADQLRRAALSISLNTAEGSSRTKKEFKRFLGIARGSCFECVPLIELAHRQGLLSTKERLEWYNHSVSLARMVSKLKSSL